MNMQILIKKIVSGGQAGVDRAALDVAILLNIPHGGWCPKGRLAVDGPIAHRYQLKETPTSEYSERTAWNVRDSDATLILVRGEPKGGTQLTANVAAELKKPYLIVDLSNEQSINAIVEWIVANKINILNIAGPRATEDAEIYQLAYDAIQGFLSRG